MLLQRLLLGFVATGLTVSSCSLDRPTSPEVIQVFFDLRTQANVEVAEAVTDKLSQIAKEEQLYIFNIATNSIVETIGSSPGDSAAIQTVFDRLKLTHSKDKALIQGIQLCLDRVRSKAEIRPIKCIFVTQGTSNTSILATMYHLWNSLATENPKNVRLYFLGILPTHRLPMSNSVKPMREFVQFAGTSAEINQILNQF